MKLMPLFPTVFSLTSYLGLKCTCCHFGFDIFLKLSTFKEQVSVNITRAGAKCEKLKSLKLGQFEVICELCLII